MLLQPKCQLSTPWQLPQRSSCLECCLFPMPTAQSTFLQSKSLLEACLKQQEGMLPNSPSTSLCLMALSACFFAKGMRVRLQIACALECISIGMSGANISCVRACGWVDGWVAQCCPWFGQCRMDTALHALLHVLAGGQALCSQPCRQVNARQRRVEEAKVEAVSTQEAQEKAQQKCLSKVKMPLGLVALKVCHSSFHTSSRCITKLDVGPIWSSLE